MLDTGVQTPTQVMANTSQQIDIKYSANGPQTMGLYTSGFDIPTGI